MEDVVGHGEPAPRARLQLAASEGKKVVDGLRSPQGIAPHPLFFLGTSKAVEVRQGGDSSGAKARIPLTPACLALRGDVLYAAAGRMLAVPLLATME